MNERVVSFPVGNFPAGTFPASRLGALAVSVRAPSEQVAPEVPRWNLREITGRLAELSGLGGTACLTLAFSMVLDAQQQGETVTWVTADESSFFPLDAAACGVDLAALAVVRVPYQGDIARAADRLARSGAFGLIVLDLGRHTRVPTALQARLRGLAQKHEAAVLCLTEKRRDMPSLGSLVSIRGAACLQRLEEDRFNCELLVVKDKNRGPGWTHTEFCRGPDGFY